MPKVRQVRRALSEAGLAVDVEVDGGIDEHTVVDAARSGANVFVAGSAVFGRPHPLEAAGDILRAAVEARGRRSVLSHAARTTQPPVRRRLDGRGRGGGRVGPGHAPRPTPGWERWWCPTPADGRPRFAGATAPPGGPHAEVIALAGRRAPGPRGHLVRHPRALCPPRPDARRAPTPSSRPGSAGWWWPWRTPIRWSSGPGDRRPAVGGDRGRPGGGGRAGRTTSWPPTSSTGAPVGRGWCSSWRPRSTGASPPPTGPAGGSPGRRPACDAHRLRAQVRRRARGGRARSGPTTRP